MLKSLATKTRRQIARNRLRGGISPVLSYLGKAYADYVGDYFSDWGKEKEKYDAEKAAMEAYINGTEGGEGVWNTKDFFAGPVGWVRMGLRKKRENEMSKLRKKYLQKVIEREGPKLQEKKLSFKDHLNRAKIIDAARQRQNAALVQQMNEDNMKKEQKEEAQQQEEAMIKEENEGERNSELSEVYGNGYFY